jgi:hypothetical protein
MAISAEDRIAINDLIALHGRDAAIVLGDRNPVGHHVTNVILTEMDEQAVRVRSESLTAR